MNVFRSLARSFWNAIDFRSKPAEAEGRSPGDAPEKKRRASRLRDGFEYAQGTFRRAFTPSARGDGFEVGARGAPVDLTGGVKWKYSAPDEPSPAPAHVPSDFVASLDDLGLLLEQPVPERPSAGPEAVGASEPLDFFEYPAPIAQQVALPQQVIAVEQPVAEQLVAVGQPVPIAVEQPVTEQLVAVEQSEPVAVEQPAAFEQPAAVEQPGPVAVEQPAAVVQPVTVEHQVAVEQLAVEASIAVEHEGSLEQPVTGEQAAVAGAQQPGPAAQFTVELLMPVVGTERAAQPRAAGQFSTLELLDTVDQLTTVAPSPDEQASGEPARVVDPNEP